MIYMFLAEGFEEVEALCPLDIMRRAGLKVTTVGIGSGMITGAHGITVKADICDVDYSGAELEMIFLPGGMPGTLNLEKSAVVQGAIDSALVKNSYIAAICAAPSILGKRGILRGREAICYPGFEDQLEGAVISDKKVVTDGRIMTAAGMGVACEFGLEIVARLCGREKAESLRHAIIAD